MIKPRAECSKLNEARLVVEPKSRAVSLTQRIGMRFSPCSYYIYTHTYIRTYVCIYIYMYIQTHIRVYYSQIRVSWSRFFRNTKWNYLENFWRVDQFCTSTCFSHALLYLSHASFSPSFSSIRFSTFSSTTRKKKVPTRFIDRVRIESFPSFFVNLPIYQPTYLPTATFHRIKSGDFIVRSKQSRIRFPWFSWIPRRIKV